MAGYLFGLDSHESLLQCIQTGVYSTRQSNPNGTWNKQQEGTFADYCSMKEGDYVYFFIKRKIYGIGQLVNVEGDCKYLNYPSSNIPETQNYDEIQDLLLLDTGEESIQYRFVCLFKPEPFFFENGIDMDDVLSSNPDKFKILRVFWKLSFIKFADDENQAFKDIILRRNHDSLLDERAENFIISTYELSHADISQKLVKNNYILDAGPFLNTVNDDESIRHEMAIEAALIHQLSIEDPNTIATFGKWDYLSHQVVASPFKPVDYIDKMDIFGYSYIEQQKPTIGNYLLIEIKRNEVTEQDILQLMKYVDWIRNEYSSGDYSLINAFLVGFSFEPNCLDNLKNKIERKYISGVRPSIAKTWTNVKLVKYCFIEQVNRLSFEIVANATE